MRFRERGIERNRASGRFLGLWHGRFRPLESVKPNHVTRIGKPGPRGGIVRIETNGSLKAFCCAEDVPAPSVQQSSALQVELIRFEAAGAWPHGRWLAAAKGNFETIGNRAGDVV